MANQLIRKYMKHLTNIVYRLTSSLKPYYMWFPRDTIWSRKGTDQLASSILIIRLINNQILI